MTESNFNKCSVSSKKKKLMVVKSSGKMSKRQENLLGVAIEHQNQVQRILENIKLEYSDNHEEDNMNTEHPNVKDATEDME